MKKFATQFALTLLACAVLAACSEKVVNAPAPVPAPVAAPQPVVAAAPASPSVAIGEPSPAADTEAPPVPQAKQAELVCEDRKIELKGSCVELYGPFNLACTSLALTVSSAEGEKLNERIFPTEKGAPGDPDTVTESIGDISCVRAKSGEKYIVTTMDNGGNCPECEWIEAYDWNGKQIGSTRDKPKSALVNELGGLTREKAGLPNLIGQNKLEKFYASEAQ